MQSAGLLMCRRAERGFEVFLVHPGGPYFSHKEDGWWTLPKGLPEAGEELLQTAMREFHEETGFAADRGPFVPIGTVTQKGGKVVHAWAFLGDCDPARLQSNEFELEWPRGSGRRVTFPEVDRAGFFTPEEARRKIMAAQVPFIDRAVEALGGEAPRPEGAT